jgi:hypothetical protein
LDPHRIQPDARGPAFETGYDPKKLRQLQAEGKLPSGYVPPTPLELHEEEKKTEQIVSGRLQAAPEVFAIPLVPLLNRRRGRLSYELRALTEERDAYLLRYFLWAQLRPHQRFRKVDFRLKLPTKGRFSIYSMWPESQEVVTASASLRLDVGVDPSLGFQVPKVSIAPGVDLGGGFHADAEGRFLVFKEWQRLKAVVQAQGRAGRIAEWLLEKPKRFVGNVEFLLIVLTPKGLEKLVLQADGTYLIKHGVWKSPVEVKFKQRAKAEIAGTP